MRGGDNFAGWVQVVVAAATRSIGSTGDERVQGDPRRPGIGVKITRIIMMSPATRRGAAQFGRGFPHHPSEPQPQ